MRHKKGYQPMGVEAFIEACSTCKYQGSELCDECLKETISGYEPEEERGITNADRKGGRRMNAYAVIREYLSDEELLTQLAEEAAELGKAALKLRRVCSGVNPTPVTYEEAINNLKEEIADVKLLLSVLGLDSNYMEISMIQGEKLARWIGRLNKSGGKDSGTKETN